MSRNIFRYSTPCAGPGLTAAAYALPKDYDSSDFGFGAGVEPIPPLTLPSADQLPDRGIGRSLVEPITRPSRARAST